MPTPSGWVFLFLACVLLPWLAIRSATRVRRPGGVPTRAQYLVSVAISQAILLVPALLAARYDVIALFPSPRFSPEGLAAAAVLLIVALGTLPMRWRWKPPEERRQLLWMYPHRPADLRWWALVSLAAGVGEEIVYRGVLFTLWMRMLDSWWASVAICVVVFALAHFVQGWRAVLAVVLFAVGFHVVVRLTGDLYTAIAAHFVYDFLAGVIVLRLIRREGLLQGGAGG
jgi:membrane protease YdiL (CAAX protease family)